MADVFQIFQHRNHHLLLPKTKRCFITTDSKNFYHKSPNLIKSLTPTHSEQVFVNDITYIKLQDQHAYPALVTDLYSKKVNQHAYPALVTDLYSKKVMGYKLDDNMKAGLVKDALTMAINNCEHNHQTIIATEVSSIVALTTQNLQHKKV